MQGYAQAKYGVAAYLLAGETVATRGASRTDLSEMRGQTVTVGRIRTVTDVEVLREQGHKFLLGR